MLNFWKRVPIYGYGGTNYQGLFKYSLIEATTSFRRIFVIVAHTTQWKSL